MRKIEDVRTAGDVGSSLAAVTSLTAEGDDYALLNSLGDDLRFVLIVSEVHLNQGTGPLNIDVHASTHQKCERCWHHRADVGHNSEHPTLCGRCDQNLFGTGEHREHA